MNLNNYYSEWQNAINDVFGTNEYQERRYLNELSSFIQSDDIIGSFSEEQKERSIIAFRIAFSGKSMLKEKGEEIMLFRLCVLFSQYKVDVSNLRSTTPETLGSNEICKLFEKAFAKYEVIKILTLNFHLLDFQKIDDLINVMQGASPKEFFKDEFYLSESQIRTMYNFKDVPYYLNKWRGLEEIIERAIEVSKFKAQAPNEDDFLFRFFSEAPYWEEGLNRFKEDSVFWLKAYAYFLKNKENEDFIDFGNYIPFIKFRRENTQQEFRFNGRSLQNLNELVFEYNQQENEEYLRYQKELTSSNWKSNNQLINELEYNDENYDIIELCSGSELAFEGDLMKNCIEQYVEDCYHGWTAIFSVRKNGEVLFNFELMEKKIIQAYGVSNTSLSLEQMEVLKLWSKLNKLGINLTK